MFLGVVLALVSGCDSRSSGDDDDDDSSSSSASCSRYCERMQSAGCSNFDHGACVGGCADVADMAKDTTQCSSEVDRLLACFDGLSDICASTRFDDTTGKLEACNSETEDYSLCVQDYCQDHDSKSYCN